MFRFKQFAVEDGNSSMKTGTDAVLLGAWCEVENASRILDVGCGCGIIALMLAQRSGAEITGIDIDMKSVVQASQNFLESPWSSRLSAKNIALQEFYDELFDVLVSNPPFFSNSLQVPDNIRRNHARHNHLLGFDVLARHTNRLLQPQGFAYYILPPDSMAGLIKEMAFKGLYPQKIMHVSSIESGEVRRQMACFGHSPVNVAESSLCLRNADGQFSSDYIALTSSYYLNF